MNNDHLFIFLICFMLTSSLVTGFPENREKIHEEVVNCTDGGSCVEAVVLRVESHEALNPGPPRTKRSAAVPLRDRRAFRNMLLGASPHKKLVLEQPQEDELQTDASELLLELMVRIAAHPQQWNQVHQLLQKIDNDILTSKRLLNDLEEEKEEEESSTISSTTEITTQQPTTQETTTENQTVGEVQRLIILLDNEQETRKRNNTQKWPNLEEDQPVTEKTPKYPWNKPLKNVIPKEKEFTFHRVTGKPLHYRSNVDKTTARNAYVAVSAVNQDRGKDALLEDELRQLKPWSHQENLNRMETLRKKWFLESQDDQK